MGSSGSERTADDFVSLKSGEEDVHEPEEEKDARRDELQRLVPTQLGSSGSVSEDGNEPSDEKDGDGDRGAEDVDRDGEGQSASLHLELGPLKKNYCLF